MKTYLVTRTHGLILSLIKSEEYNLLISGKIDLNKLGYNVSFEKDFVEKIFNAIVGKFVDRIVFLEKITPDYSDFFRAFLERLEVENIKAKLRYLRGFKNKEVYYPYEYFISKKDLMLINNEYELLNFLKNTPLDITYYINKLKNEDEKDLVIKEILLDIKYYEYYFSTLKEFKKFLFPMVNLERIVTYIFWCTMIGEEKISKLLLLFNIKNLNYAEISHALGLSKNDLQRHLENKHYMRLLEIAEDNFINKLKKNVLRNKDNIFFVYYYMIASYYEMKNLEKILLGRKIGLRPEVIRGTLKLFI